MSLNLYSVVIIILPFFLEFIYYVLIIIFVLILELRFDELNLIEEVLEAQYTIYYY